VSHDRLRFNQKPGIYAHRLLKQTGKRFITQELSKHRLSFEWDSSTFELQLSSSKGDDFSLRWQHSPLKGDAFYFE
jgi:hypothetical protein